MNNLQKEKSYSILLLKMKIFNIQETPQRYSHLSYFQVVLCGSPDYGVKSGFSIG